MKVYVKFADGSNNYHTTVNELSKADELEAYFVGTQFDLGIYPKEKLLECIEIDITHNHNKVYIEKVYPLKDMNRYDFHKYMVWNKGEQAKDFANKVMYFDKYGGALRVRNACIEVNKANKKHLKD